MQLPLRIGTALAVALFALPAAAQEIKDSANAAKDAVRGIGQSAKEFGTGMVDAAKDTGRAIGQGAKSIAQDVSKGVRRDVTEGGALKGTNRPNQTAPGQADPP